MTTLFISDLHLDAASPGIGAQFRRFLDGQARDARALYVLGDLFEAWVGDDDPQPAHAETAAALRALSDSGVAVYMMRGNRDVMLGDAFCAEAGAVLLPDPLVTEVEGTRVLLTHGDALCTGDAAYQKLRALLRDPEVRRGLGSLSLSQRQALAGEARAGSRAHLEMASEYITDVAPAAVEHSLRAAGVDVIIHGHTHRPALHSLEVDGRPRTRIVLGDWHTQGSVLRWDANGYELMSLPR